MVELGPAPGIRPRPSLWRRLDLLARAAFPAVCTVLLLLLANAPFGFADQAALAPSIAVVAVFFWTLYRPAAMPALAVFGLGLLLDLIGWLPLGAGVLMLLSVHAVALRIRRPLARQRFLAIWTVFAGFAAGAAALTWALAALLELRLLPLGPALFQALLSAALYPALAIPFAHAHRDLAAPERA
ncbi:MAG: rod shape-determining protein MreD [Rhodospirillales bacterium]|nr:rod shape-determining protein MreD [Rhodospirillales bacterium]